ncbi:hypothetical protein STVIR_0494 [Streptomyces viridochromogenes Tue57]|uniref:Uncharacterized protein n=1 Tax=Streptomyces viridochromogenes Tue57 TaxID=1160705 RepID=L8PLS7_STRVR|nr:hypothetical protein STVIR_0494 [Streptomyces viridochromogenes Tue57]
MNGHVFTGPDELAAVIDTLVADTAPREETSPVQPLR